MKSANVEIWVVDASNQLFIRDSLIKTEFSKKYISYWKNSILCDTSILYSPFHILFPHSSDKVVLYKNVKFSALVLSTKKGYSSVLKKVFAFQKICFKVKVLKTFKVSSDCT